MSQADGEAFIDTFLRDNVLRNEIYSLEALIKGHRDAVFDSDGWGKIETDTTEVLSQVESTVKIHADIETLTAYRWGIWDGAQDRFSGRTARITRTDVASKRDVLRKAGPYQDVPSRKNITGKIGKLMALSSGSHFPVTDAPSRFLRRPSTYDVTVFETNDRLGPVSLPLVSVEFLD